MGRCHSARIAKGTPRLPLAIFQQVACRTLASAPCAPGPAKHGDWRCSERCRTIKADLRPSPRSMREGAFHKVQLAGRPTTLRPDDRLHLDSSLKPWTRVLARRRQSVPLLNHERPVHGCVNHAVIRERSGLREDDRRARGTGCDVARIELEPTRGIGCGCVCNGVHVHPRDPGPHQDGHVVESQIGDCHLPGEGRCGCRRTRRRCHGSRCCRGRRCCGRRRRCDWSRRWCAGGRRCGA